MVKNYFLYLILLFPFSFGAQIKITEVYYDTPYNERLTLTNNATGTDENAIRHHWGEFIELYNYTDKDLSLKNWYIQDFVGTYWLPDRVIKAGSFVVVAYSQPTKDTTPFTELFSTTVGKEDQIIYQNQILLRNKAEGLKLGYYAFDGKVPLPVVDAVGVGNGINPSSNRVKKAWQYPDICYTFPCVQLTSATNYASVIPPNPLDATYKPPTKNYEALMFDTYQQYYAYLDWSENVLNLTENTCPLSISKIEQIPTGSYNSGQKCFNYDIAGNNTTAIDCVSLPSNPPPNEYSVDELEAIRNSIFLYPNPTTSNNQYTVTISWNGAAISKINNLKVFNSTGGLVYGFTPVSNSNSTSFSLHNQLPGVFVANFVLNTGQVISKNILKW